MSTYLQFAVLGLSAGAVYVALANGVIAVYGATGILNFAQGAMAAWGVYVYSTLRSTGELILPVGQIDVGVQSLFPAMLIGILCAIAIGLLSHLLVFRPLRQAPVLAQVVASVGLMIVMQSLVLLRFGNDAVYLEAILPGETVSVFGANLQVSSLWLAGAAIALTVATSAYFRFTRLGIATRAGSQDERAVRLMGYSPDRLAAIVWGASVGVSSLIIILAAPTVGLNPIIYTWAVVPALAVALLGRLTSFPKACAAGLALGAFQAVATFLTSKPSWPSWAVTGLQDAIPFLVIIVALFVFGGRIPARGSVDALQLPQVTIPRLKVLPIAAVVAAGAVLLVVTSGSLRFGVVTSMILILLSLSYVLLTGYLGQISLAQMAFAGTAGFLLSKLTTGWDIPFPLSFLMAASGAALLGVIVGLPAVRIRGAQLAVATLALALAVESFVFNNPKLTPLSGNKIGEPSLLGLDLSIRRGEELTRLPFAFMVLAVVLIFVLLTAQLMRGDVGRAFLAIRSNERAAASVGLDVARAKLLGFVISAFIAGIAGTLMGYSRGQLSAESFTAFGGLSLLALAYLGGIGSLSGAVIAGLMGPLGVFYVLLNDGVSLGEYYTLFAGASLVLTAIFNPVGISGAMRSAFDRVRFSRRVQPPSQSALEVPR